MRKIRNLIGMPVLAGGRKLGRLLQADLSGDLKRLKGVWVDCGFKGTRYIPVESLSMIGEMAVFTDGIGRRRRISAEPILRRAVSTDGRRLGAIVGAEIDELSFLVTALELTNGFWDDLFAQRQRVEAFSADPTQGEVVVLGAAEYSERETDA